MNSGDPIPQEMAARIFEPGFTTKGDKGEGMGHAICREILENAGGSIGTAEEEGWTVFVGSIPDNSPWDTFLGCVLSAIQSRVGYYFIVCVIWSL